MNQQDQEEKQTKYKSDRVKTLDSLCSMSGLVLSVVCCITLIHVELRIQEHHRLISHSVTCCDHMETKILRKVQENYGRWQEMKGSHSEGHWQETRGEFFPLTFRIFSFQKAKVFLFSIYLFRNSYFQTLTKVEKGSGNLFWLVAK